MNTAAPVLGVEQSRSWPMRLAGQIPAALDVFMLIGIDPDTERYVGWGYFESTSEPAPWPQCRGAVFVVCRTTVPLADRSRAGLKKAMQQACDALSDAFWKSPEPAYVRIRNKLAEDLAFLRAQGTHNGIAVERVDQSTFAEILRGAVS